MSIWQAIGGALGTLVVEGINSAIAAMRSRRTVPPHSPPPWERGHNWQTLLSDPPMCAWCELPRTQHNANGPCDGPPPHKR